MFGEGGSRKIEGVGREGLGEKQWGVRKGRSSMKAKGSLMLR